LHISHFLVDYFPRELRKFDYEPTEIDILDYFVACGVEEMAHALFFTHKRKDDEFLLQMLERFGLKNDISSIAEYNDHEMERRVYKWKRYLAPKSYRQAYQSHFEEMLSRVNRSFKTFKEYKTWKSQTK